jgi:hypothetical protein
MNSGTGIGTGEENVKILLAEILQCCDSILEALDVPSSSSAAAGAGGTMKEQHTVIGGGSGALGAGALDGATPTRSCAAETSCPSTTFHVCCPQSVTTPCYMRSTAATHRVAEDCLTAQLEDELVFEGDGVSWA